VPAVEGEITKQRYIYSIPWGMSTEKYNVLIGGGIAGLFLDNTGDNDRMNYGFDPFRPPANEENKMVFT
jgi:hypothetical protein